MKSKTIGKEGKRINDSKMGMKVLNLFTRLHGRKTTDSQSGYRAYSRRAIEKIKITNMFI